LCLAKVNNVLFPWPCTPGRALLCQIHLYVFIRPVIIVIYRLKLTTMCLSQCS